MLFRLPYNTSLHIRESLSSSYSLVMSVTEATRNSVIADKPRDAFGGQSRSPNMVPLQ